jgi:uncharacterized membrane protein YagU involved in acid resistance
MSARGDRVVAALLIGTIGGIVATTAMTWTMDVMFRRLPKPYRYPVPPRELTERISAMAGVCPEPNDARLMTATLASHFGYGALTGAIFPLLMPTRRLLGAASGISYGLAIWAISYLGWIPALGILRPATEHPLRRNGLMIAAHVVWGSVLGFVAAGLSTAVTPFSNGPLRDR